MISQEHAVCVGTWCCNITSASHVESPGSNPQRARSAHGCMREARAFANTQEPQQPWDAKNIEETEKTEKTRTSETIRGRKETQHAPLATKERASRAPMCRVVEWESLITQ